MRKSKIGKHGEFLAVNYLKTKKHLIIAQNYYYNRCEIDIIAQKSEILIAIEVKLRTAPFILNPYKTVDLKKQKKIVQVMNHYVQTNSIDKNIRFDIVSIVLFNGQYKIEHIKHAFYPSLWI